MQNFASRTNLSTWLALVTLPPRRIEHWVYIGGGGTQTATLSWKFLTAGSVYSTVAINADGTIYVGSDDTNLYALDQNGNIKWAASYGEQILR